MIVRVKIVDAVMEEFDPSAPVSVKAYVPFAAFEEAEVEDPPPHPAIPARTQENASVVERSTGMERRLRLCKKGNPHIPKKPIAAPTDSTSVIPGFTLPEI